MCRWEYIHIWIKKIYKCKLNTFKWVLFRHPMVFFPSWKTNKQVLTGLSWSPSQPITLTSLGKPVNPFAFVHLHYFKWLSIPMCLSCFLREECWLFVTVFDFRFYYPRRHNLIHTRTDIMNRFLLHTVSGLYEDRQREREQVQDNWRVPCVIAHNGPLPLSQAVGNMSHDSAKKLDKQSWSIWGSYWFSVN